MQWTEIAGNEVWLGQSGQIAVKVRRVLGGVHIWRKSPTGWVMAHQLMLSPQDAMVWCDKKYGG